MNCCKQKGIALLLRVLLGSKHSKYVIQLIHLINYLHFTELDSSSTPQIEKGFCSSRQSCGVHQRHCTAFNGNIELGEKLLNKIQSHGAVVYTEFRWWGGGPGSTGGVLCYIGEIKIFSFFQTQNMLRINENFIIFENL